MLEKQKGNQVRDRVTRTRRKKTFSIRADVEENGSGWGSNGPKRRMMPKKL